MAKFIVQSLAAAAALFVGAAPTMAAITVYQNNFTSGAGSEWSNNSTVTSNGEAFLGANQSGSLALGFGPGTDRLTLSGLAAHTQATVTFDLYIIQSWDGNAQNGGGTGDYWGLQENAQQLLLTNFANYTGGNTQQFVSQANPNGGPVAPRTGESDAGHLGFGTGDFGDATYHFSYTFTDSSSTLLLDFTGYENQQPGDEGWGLDNVLVTTNADTIAPAVAEPASLTLWGLGALGCALAGYRRRKAA